MDDGIVEVVAWAIATAPASASVVWNDFHGAVTRVASDAMAFPLRRRGYDVFVTAPWTDPASRARAVAWVDQVGRALRPFGDGVYVNNLTDEEAHRVPEAYGPNYRRLAEIKRIYDPDNFFRTNHNIRPAAGIGPD